MIFLTDLQLIFTGMLFETFVILIASIILILIFLKYLEKRQRMTLVLFFIFVFFVFAIVFSWLSKVIRLYGGLNYIIDNELPDPLTIESYFILRIVEFRFAFIFIILSLAFSYVLKVGVYQKEYNQKEKLFVIIYGVLAIFYQFFLFARGLLILDLIAFTLVTFYMIFIYIPFFKHSVKNYRSVDDPVYKKGFLSLAIMAFSLTLILVCQLIDRVFVIALDIVGYTPFYFAGWTFALIALFGAYFGYIRPKSKE